MTIRKHPDPSTLMAYTSGTLPGALSGLVACHVSLCPQCARDVGRLEAAAGTMLGGIEPVDGDRTDTKMPSGVTKPAMPITDQPHPKGPDDPVLPRPLANYIGLSSDEIPWKPVVKGLEQYWVKLPSGAGHMRLLKAPPRFRLLEHTHSGSELTLVLKGSYRDETGEYFRGDVADLDDDVLHTPKVSSMEECICVIASEKLPRYSNWYARMLQPFLKI